MAWSASKPISALMLSDVPALVLSPDGARMLWANPKGAARLGAGNLETLLQDELPQGLSLRRQVKHLFRWLRSDQEQVQRLRLGHSATTPLDMVRVSKLRNIDGVLGILLQPVDAKPSSSAGFDADELTRWLASGHHYAALLSSNGEVISASGAFQELRRAAGELQDLLDDAEDSLVPVSRHLNIESGIRHLVTGFKFPLDGQDGTDAFLLLVDAEEISLKRPTSPSQPGRMDAADIKVPKAANDARPVSESEISQDRGDAAAEPAEDLVSKPDQVEQLAETEIVEAEQSDAADIMRFVWRMDDSFRFTFVSPEFQVLVGLRGAMEGRSWQDLAGDFQLDPDGQVQAAILSKDIWSGQSIIWRLPKRKARAQIELSAMPVFDGERNFQGYRGFGACRLEDDTALPDTPSEPATPVDVDSQEAVAEPAEPVDETPQIIAEVPAIIDTRDDPELRGREHLRGLTSDERKAFEEIGRALGDKPLSTTVRISEEPAPIEPTPIRQENEPKPAAKNLKPQSTSQQLATYPRLVETGASVEAALRLVLDRVETGVLVVREDRLLFANKALAKLAGYPDTESYMSADAAGAMGGFALDPVKDSDGIMQLTGLHNVAHPVRASIGKIDWAGQPASLLVVEPVPAKTESAPQSEPETSGEIWNADELLAILNTATEGVLMINADGKVLALNHGAEALFGEDQANLTGRELTELLAPESHKTALDYLQGIMGAGVASVLNDGREVIGRTAQGGYMPLFMTMGRVGDETLDTNNELRLCVVLRDITQWKRAEDDLIAARHNAEKASTAKSDFLAKISHEIRTPLNAILGFSEVIMEERFGPIGNPRYKDYINDIHTSGAHVINLVNDMLDISKIEAGQLDLNFSAVDLVDVLKECVALMQPQANEARVIIRTSFGDELPRVVADAKTVRQIALNLLSNSIKFTSEGGQVIVSAVLEKDGSLVLRVRDTGVGMDEADIATAMEPFRQVDSKNPGRNVEKGHLSGGGTGLGLPLTKALVEANRAGFFIESTPAKGTLIRVVFPNTRVLAE